MTNDKGNTWYALPEGKDQSDFKNWEQIDERRVIVMVPARSCAECHGEIKIEAWMEHKQITFMDALFDFEYAGIMVCPACWKKIGKGLPLPATTPNLQQRGPDGDIAVTSPPPSRESGVGKVEAAPDSIVECKAPMNRLIHTSLPVTAPNGGTRAVSRVGDAPVVVNGDATAATEGYPISGTSGNDPRRGTPRADACRGGKAGAAKKEKK